MENCVAKNTIQRHVLWINNNLNQNNKNVLHLLSFNFSLHIIITK